MSHIALNLTALMPFALLLLAVLGLWIHRAVWIAALVASIAAALYTGAIAGIAVILLMTLTLLAMAFRRALDSAPSPKTTALRICFGFGFFVFALAMALNLLPGLPRTALTETTRLTSDALPYGIGLGFSKVVAGILILGLLNTTRVRSFGELMRILGRTTPIWMVTVAAVVMFCLAMDYVRFDPKWTTLFWTWAVVNLFFTCLAEEAFFRGFVQHELAKIGSNRRLAAGVALVVSAVLFGLAHFGGGWVYVVAGVIAGLGYGLAYQLTQRIEAAMAVHFGVNAAHFLLFTYPALS